MKKWITLFLCLVLLAVLPCPVHAADTYGPIVDNADLLTTEEEQKLYDQAMELYLEHDLWVSIITVNTLGGKTAESYADDFYDNHYYSSYPDGVLLLIAMDSREWAISTCGTGISMLNDWELDELFYRMSDNLADNDFYPAFAAYLDAMPDYLGHGNADPGIGDYIRIVLVALTVGAAVGGIAILVMRSQMNTAKAQQNAGNYLVNGSYQLKRHHDIFLYSRVTRTRKAENNGSSTHRSSGGVRHGGRSGRF